MDDAGRADIARGLGSAAHAPGTEGTEGIEETEETEGNEAGEAVGTARDVALETESVLEDSEPEQLIHDLKSISSRSHLCPLSPFQIPSIFVLISSHSSVPFSFTYNCP